VSESASSTGKGHGWTWAGRAADIWQLAVPLASAIPVVLAFVVPGLSRRELQIFIAGLVMMAVGGWMLIRALKERGDPIVACDHRRNKRLTLRLWSSVILTLVAIAVWIIAAVALGN
jgi:hypothetical protein